MTVMGYGARKVVVVLDTGVDESARRVALAVRRRAGSGLARAGRLGDGAEVMVLEAGVQPRVDGLAQPRPRSGPRGHPGRGARRSPGSIAGRPCTRRAPWAATPRPHRRTDSRVHRRRLHAAQQSRHVRPTRALGRRGAAQSQRGHHEPERAPELFRRAGLPGLRLPRQLHAPGPGLHLHAGGRWTRHRRAAADRSQPSVRRSVVLPFKHEGGAMGRGPAQHRRLDFATDNSAWAVLPPPRKIAVTLVSPGNLFLEKVLRTDPQVELDVKKPYEYQSGMGEADVVYPRLRDVHSCRPWSLRLSATRAGGRPPRGARASRAAHRDGLGLHASRDAARRVRQGHHRGLPADPALAAGRPLVEAVGGPLIYALEEQDRKAVFMGFDLFKTDFPLRVAFPLILSNSLRWLHPAGLDQTSLQLAAGQPILLPVPHGVTTATVTTPSGVEVPGRQSRRPAQVPAPLRRRPHQTGNRIRRRLGGRQGQRRLRRRRAGRSMSTSSALRSFGCRSNRSPSASAPKT